MNNPVIRKKNGRGWDFPAPKAAIMEHNSAHAVSAAPPFCNGLAADGLAIASDISFIGLNSYYSSVQPFKF